MSPFWRHVTAWVIVFVIVAAPLAGLWLRRRDAKANRAIQTRLELLEALLLAWAETWGEPSPVVKERLRAILTKFQITKGS